MTLSKPLSFAVLLSSFIIASSDSPAASTAWNAASGDWNTPANWTNGVPGNGDDAYIDSGTAKITSDSAILGSFTMSGGTLIFTNWGTRLIATNVTIDDATVTLPAPFDDTEMSNRVYFACSNNFTLGSNATIQASQKGFTRGYGPGIGDPIYGGAGHGGVGGQGNADKAGSAYDSLTAPVQPGSGGSGTSHGGYGGGAVRIHAGNKATVFGAITANGGNYTAYHGAGASGGSIYITCKIFDGSPNGLLQVNGGRPIGNGGCGAGGRIAVVYNPANQTSTPGVRMQAAHGTTAFKTRWADVGTVYLPNALFLSSVMDGQIFRDCRLTIAGMTEWNLGSLAITNASFDLAMTGLVVRVTNDLIVSSGGFGIPENGELHCGNIVLSGSSELNAYGGVTNGSPAYGALVDVTGNVTIGAGSWIMPYSHPTNGGSAFFDIGGDITIADTGGFNANYSGFQNLYGPGSRSAEPGPYGGGASYGGQGAPGSALPRSVPYGNFMAPSLCGSGGGPLNLGGRGGGLIWIKATNGTVTVNGTLTANGQLGNSTHHGSGSGGGIYVECEQVAGSSTGLIRANGNNGNGGGGASGGGRIALIYDPGVQSGVNPGVRFEAVAGVGGPASGLKYARNGTVYLADSSFLSSSLSNDQFDDVFVTFGNNFTNWNLDSLSVDLADMVIANTDLVIRVTNTVTLSKDADFGIANGSTLICSNLVMNNDGLLSTAGSTLRLYSGATNGTALDYGVLLKVLDSATIVSNATIYAYSDHTDGGSPLLQIKDLTVAVGGSINADGHGYKTGEGPGAGAANWGAGGYGGKGGAYSGAEAGQPYGSKSAPAAPGSGGYDYANFSGSGGGLIRIESGGTVDLAGLLTADGYRGWTTHCNGGSGGGIFVQCRTFHGQATGQMSANGGRGLNNGGGGGGGRIAIWRFEDTSAGTISTNVNPADGLRDLPDVRGAYTGTVFAVITAPALTNAEPQSVTNDSAKMVGYLTSTGFSPTVVRCYWGETDGEDVPINWDTNNLLGTQEIGFITNEVSGLTESTVYHYRFYATNTHGEAWASPSYSFATPGTSVFVNVDLGATNISATGARLRGTVTAGTPDPNVYVCWGTTNGGGSTTTTWDHVEDIGPYLGDFEVVITNLLANKTYYYRAYAKNTSDDDWADFTTNFTTKGPKISISNAEVTEGDVDMDFTVSVSATSVLAVSATYTSSDGSAKVGDSDYLATNGTVSLLASQMTATVTVKIKEDAVDEFPSENLFVTLTGPSNCELGDDQGEGTITDDDATPETNRWNGTGNWTDTTKWSQGREPRDVDYAIIQSGNALMTSPKSMMTLNVESGAALTFSNWTTYVQASNIVVESGAEVTVAGPFNIIQMTNRIHFVCSNLTLEATALIDADGAGFTGVGTPGVGKHNGGTGGGGGHGGRGERGASDAQGGDEYDSLTAPVVPGTGGGADNGGDGGGAVRIDAGDTVAVYGTITANGTSGVGSHGGGGSGGSILINCDVLSGSSVGLIRVNAGNGYSSGGGGGGGRIAVNYATAAQGAAPLPGVRFQAKGGTGWWLDGEDGTLYLPDTHFLSSTITNQLMRDVELHVPGFTSWSLDSLTLEDSGLTFWPTNFVLTVTNDLVLDDGALGFLGNAELNAGRLIMSNASELAVWAGPTNGTVEYGALVSVTGDFFVGASSWVYPRCDETNGGAVLFRVGSDVTVESGAGFQGVHRGFRQKIGPGAGGTGGYGAGGGYGGAGAMTDYAQTDGGQPYGDKARPTLPGSGGGYDNGTYRYGGWGGGAIWIECTNGNASISGTLTANGDLAHGTHGGGASGGGIYVACDTFSGTAGLLRANGGNGSANGGAGGGGRIAVVYDTAAQGGSWPDVRCQTKRGIGGSNTGRGRISEDGTTYLPDVSAVSSNLWDGLFSDTYLFVPGLTELNKDSLTLDDTDVVLANTGIVVNVTNSLVIRGGSGLGLLGNAHLSCGSLSLEDASTLEVVSGPTNRFDGGLRGTDRGERPVDDRNQLLGLPVLRLHKRRLASLPCRESRR